MRWLLIILVNAGALAVATWLLQGITLSAADGTTMQVIRLLLVGTIFGIVNALVRPVLNFLALPLIILTLGLMLIVTNALMLMLTSKLAHGFDLGFHVDKFSTALVGAIVISLSTWVLESILPTTRR